MQLGLGKSLSIRQSQQLFPSILADGNTVAWFDYKKLITKDANDFVSFWGDKSGSNHPLLQAVGASQPEWKSDGILFDGITQFMKCVGFTFEHPEQIYIVVKQLSWQLADCLIDGSVAYGGVLQHWGNSPSIRAYAGSGTAPPTSSELELNKYGIITVLFNYYFNSYLKINDNAKKTGNVGTANMQGFTIGAQANNQFFSNIQVKEIILRKIADTTTNEANIYNYLSKKYSI